MFLNPDKMLNPFEGNSDLGSLYCPGGGSMYFECGDDNNDFHACMYNSDLENESSDDDD